MTDAPAATNEEEKKEPTKVWWLYLLACARGRTYAGIAVDVDARFRLHASGKGARFTRANPPVRILGAQPFPTRSLALKAEYALKQLRPAEKRAWAKRRGFPGVDLTGESVHSRILPADFEIDR